MTEGYTHYLFDFDGTICDSHPAIHFSLSALFSIKGLEIPSPSATRRAVGTGKGLAGVISILLPEEYRVPQGEMEEMIGVYRQVYRDEGKDYIRLFDGVAEMLGILKDRGAILIIASNKNIKAIQATLEAHQLNDRIDLVVGEGAMADGSWQMKPDRFMFEQIVLPHFPEMAHRGGLMIGDTVVDMQFAHNCRLDACWAAFGYGNHGEIMALQPKHTASHPKAILGCHPG